MAELEKTLKTNGYKLKSWGDVGALVSILAPTLAMIVGVIWWGLKLEAKIESFATTNQARHNTLLTEIGELKRQVGRGVLPRAEERINSLQHRVEQLEDH